MSAPRTSILLTGNNFTKSDPDDPEIKDYNFYIQKSKNQRTAGLVLLGGGVLLSGIGLLIGTNNLDDAVTGVVFMGVGALAGLGSIPLMILAHVNKNKAKLMLSNQKTGLSVPSNVSKDIIGFTIAIQIVK